MPTVSQVFANEAPHSSRFSGLLRHFGFEPERPSLRVELFQWHKDLGTPLEYYVDVYAGNNWIELYTRPRRTKHLSQRFNGKVETALDLARLMYQCDYITPDEWEAAQRVYGPPMRWKDTPQQFRETTIFKEPDLPFSAAAMPDENPPFQFKVVPRSKGDEEPPF